MKEKVKEKLSQPTPCLHKGATKLWLHSLLIFAGVGGLGYNKEANKYAL